MNLFEREAGFEPANTGFADHPLEPLGHSLVLLLGWQDSNLRSLTTGDLQSPAINNRQSWRLYVGEAGTSYQANLWQLPLCDIPLFCGHSWNRTTFSGFSFQAISLRSALSKQAWLLLSLNVISVLRIHHVCQMSFAEAEGLRSVILPSAPRTGYRRHSLNADSRMVF